MRSGNTLVDHYKGARRIFLAVEKAPVYARKLLIIWMLAENVGFEPARKQQLKNSVEHSWQLKAL
jgi:hypothetical protein